MAVPATTTTMAEWEDDNALSNNDDTVEMTNEESKNETPEEIEL